MTDHDRDEYKRFIEVLVKNKKTIFFCPYFIGTLYFTTICNVNNIIIPEQKYNHYLNANGMESVVSSADCCNHVSVLECNVYVANNKNDFPFKKHEILWEPGALVMPEQSKYLTYLNITRIVSTL